MLETSEKVKVHRNRKRVYETFSEETPVEEVSPVFEASAKPTVRETAEGSTTLEIATPAESVESEAASVEQEELKPLAQGDENKYHDAMRIVENWAAWGAGTGLVPVPIIDMVAMVALQMAMLRKLANLYGVPFHEQRSKSAVAAMIGGVNAGYLGGSLLKMFPLFGVLSLAAMPVVNGAITYAVGRVFIQHFASGGTFLNFDPASVKAYFEEQYRAGKQKS